ncbi:hypothetical protein FIBSPDRAFT_862753 [Athelia psychrophila]|uniref:BTB domain-containing protein n=1 Tax=Athelia psychrophila TaxID=1759441 RepID=A0A166HXI9_9AGAM|nr:hypothetical protein FIBSPDRAFT_862753 [Fibularhizoctonia sp. CBS 109695]
MTDISSYKPADTKAAHPQITEASAPFDRADADVILRSSDNGDFKLLLSMGSPFFEDMFSLPQSPTIPADDELEDIDLLLGAAMKYNIERVEKRVREALIAPKRISGNAAHVFTIACQHRMDAEARAGAKATLSQASLLDGTFGPEMHSLSPAQLFALLKYHQDCVQAARQAIANFSWFPHDPPGLSSSRMSSTSQTRFLKSWPRGCL